MGKSKLPLEQRIFIPRKSPTVIILGDGESVAGPFCVNCGNPATFHRDHDDACPVRRLHPLLPMGERERCNCPRNLAELSPQGRHAPECNRRRHGYNGTAAR
jgi:hypothetical protein